MKYKIALQKSDEGFSVSVPGLPGYWSQGTTEAEALRTRWAASSGMRGLRLRSFGSCCKRFVPPLPPRTP